MPYKISELPNVPLYSSLKQKQFSDELNTLHSNAKSAGMQLTKPHITSNIFNSLSFLYSRYQSIKLKQIYEKENGFAKLYCANTALFVNPVITAT